MKKIYIYVLSCMLILSCVSASFATEKTKDNTAATNKNLKPIQVLNANNYKTNRVEDITLEDIKQAQTAVSNDSEKAILFYNNGNALDCNDYISFESDDSMKLTQDEIINESDEIKNQCESMGYNYIDEGIDKSNINVFGVYIYDTSTGGVGEVVIASNSDKMTSNEISEITSEAILNVEENIVTANAATPVIKTISQTYKAGDTKVATLTGNITFNRISKNATVDGKACSVWDVDSFIQATGYNKRKIISEYVWLNTNQTNQKLIKYGPTGDVGKRDGYTFTLSGGGVISASFNVTFGGSYKRSDFSTISGKYGKWRYFTDTASMKNKLTTDSGIRCTNTKGNLVIKAKCQIKTMHLVGRSFHSNTYEWTPAQYSISDR